MVVRDLDKDIAYEGTVEAYSDSADENELFLRDMRVLNGGTNEQLYCLRALYLARARDKLTVEFTGPGGVADEHIGCQRGRPDKGEGDKQA